MGSGKLLAAGGEEQQLLLPAQLGTARPQPRAGSGTKPQTPLPGLGEQSPSLFPWGPVLQAPSYLPDYQTLLLSLAKAMICCDHGAGRSGSSPVQGQLLGPGPQSCPWE